MNTAGDTTELAWEISAVNGDHTVSQPVAPTTTSSAASSAADAESDEEEEETTDGAKTLVAGAIAAISMMYL